VTFLVGSVPSSLDDPVFDLDVLQIAGDGTVLVRFAAIGRMLLHHDQVICDLEVPFDAPVMTSVLFGSVLACICWRRGQLSLHGSAVALAERTVLLLGRAETGKSLLAAILAQRGHVVLSDEVAAVSGKRCFPGAGPLSLADDALATAGIDAEPLPCYDNFRIPKRLWSGAALPEPRPYPVAAVVCLAKAAADAPNQPRRLAGEDAVAAILHQVFWPGMLQVLDGESVARREAEQLAAAVPIYQFPVARDLGRIGEAAAMVEALARG
jgi:hypothetical protein